MKKAILLVSLMASALFCAGQKKRAAEAEDIVYKWVEANNRHDVEAIGSLYASELRFYGDLKSDVTCLREKEQFFKKQPGYTIRISDLDIDFYKTGAVKCNFIKTETWKDGVQKEQPAYLILKRQANRYVISEESDRRMDEKRGYRPSLGDKVPATAIGRNIIVGAAAGILVLAAGLFLISRRKRNKILAAVAAPVVPAAVQPEPAITSEEEKVNHGTDFEKFIVGKFSKEYFLLKRWSSDKASANGMYDESNKEPDLYMAFRNNNQEFRFAIECKWRKDFTTKNGVKGIYWAKDYQVKNYLEFEAKDTPVWVAIGLGGTGAQPEKLFFTRLSNLSRYPFVYESYLQQYSRSVKHNFFFDPKTKSIS